MAKTVKVDDHDWERLHKLAREWSVTHERRLSLADVINLLITFEEKRKQQVKAK